jgi:hypothetical protein
MDVTDICDGKQPLALRGIYQTSHCSVMEAYQVECEPGEVDRNHPMTLGNATKVCDGYVRGWGIYQRMIMNPFG